MMRGGKHSSVGGLAVAKDTPTIRHLCTALWQALAFMNARVQPSHRKLVDDHIEFRGSYDEATCFA